MASLIVLVSVLVLLASGYFLVIPSSIQAQSTGSTGGLVEPPSNAPSTIEDLLKVLNTGVTWLFNITLVVAVILIIYAGLRWVTAGGDEAAVGAAKKALTAALIGIGIALMAKGLISLVGQLLGVNIKV